VCAADSSKGADKHQEAIWPARPWQSISVSKEKDRKEIADGLSRLLADTYTLYLKTH
jgi:hypothetical protein